VTSFASVLALAAFAAPASPPPAVTALLSALEAGDVGAARASLADDVTIMDSRSGTDVHSSIEALADYARGCRRSEVSAEYDSEDPQRAAVSVTWTCRSHPPGQAFIWTVGARVGWVQFGMPLP